MTSLIILRLIHILLGMFWVGTAIFLNVMLFPALKGNPATMGAVGAAMNAKGVHKWLGISAMLTILSGLCMVWIVSGGDIGAYAHTRAGHAFTTAGGLAIIAFFGGLIFARPAGIKMGVIGAQLAATTDAAERSKLQGEMAALQKRTGIITMIVIFLLLLAVAGMAVARYI